MVADVEEALDLPRSGEAEDLVTELEAGAELTREVGEREGETLEAASGEGQERLSESQEARRVGPEILESTPRLQQKNKEVVDPEVEAREELRGLEDLVFEDEER